MLHIAIALASWLCVKMMIAMLQSHALCYGCDYMCMAMYGLDTNIGVDHKNLTI